MGDLPDEASRIADALQEVGRVSIGRGVAMIEAERFRQVREEGWTAGHDAQHTDESLAMAAAYYAWPGKIVPDRLGVDRAPFPIVSLLWPPSWHPGHAKKHRKDRIQQLTVAGALCAAEIDRLERVEE